MNYTFFGTPEFAEIILENLIKKDFKPSTVVCNPDRPAGRNQVITPPPTKVIAQENNIDLYQPEKLSIYEFKKHIPNHDFAVLAAYGKIIPKEIIEYFPKGIIGVHPSLLPKYRGPTPIRSAMLDKEEATGVTLFLTEKGVDSGPIISQREVNIGGMTYPELKKELANIGSKMVAEDVSGYLAGKIDPKPQEGSKASQTTFFKTSDAEIKFNDLKSALKGDKNIAEKINTKVKSLNPEPGVWTMTEESDINYLPKNKRVKLLESHLENGKIVLDKIHVAGEHKPRKL